ncbi:MAG: hypothetical protein ACP5NK_05075 [Thermoplasmata archaeon]
MNKRKPLALAIVAVVILSSTFIFFNFQYPSAQSTLLKVPKPPPVNLSNFIFFSNQSLDRGNFGNLTSNYTGFKITGDVNTTVQGFLSSSVTRSPLSDTTVIVALYPVAVVLRTNNSGFYSFETLKGGYGNLTYKPLEFHQQVVHVDLTGRLLWENLSFSPALKYNISGYTVFSSNPIPSVGIYLNGAIYSTSTASNQFSVYDVSLYNGTYNVTVYKSGFANLPQPLVIYVHGSNVTDYNLTLFPLGNFTINGTVLTQQNYPIHGASVVDSGSHYLSVTNIYGNYSVAALNGDNILHASAPGFYSNTTSVQVTHDVSNVLIRLTPIDPFPVGNRINNTSIPGYINGTNKLPLTNSSLNYSTKGSYVIQGYIFGWRHMPVANQSFYFLIRVLGQFYATLVNSTQNGMYSLPVNYLGNYDLLVESKVYESSAVNFSASSTSANLVNISMTPVIKFYGNLTGLVENSLDHSHIAAADLIIYGGNMTSYNERNVTNSTGGFNMTFYPGTYHIVGSAPGFYTNNSVNIFVVSRLIELTVYLKPDVSIGNNLSAWYPANGTGIPGVSPSNITGNLTGNGSSDGYYPFSVILKPEYLNSPVKDSKYEVFVRINGMDYRAINSTNSSGESVLSLYYAGDYQLIMEFQDFYSRAVNFSVPNDTTVIIPVFEKVLYQMKINSINSFNLTYGFTNLSVPVDYLNFTNDIFPADFITTLSLYGTNYTENLPSGTYNLSYVNSGFVQHNFSIALPQNTPKHVSLDPYEILIQYNTDISWNVTVNGGTNLIYSQGTGRSPLPETSGSYSVDFFISGYKGYTNQSNFLLTSNSYYKVLYFNVSRSNVTSDVTGSQISISGVSELDYAAYISGKVYIFSAIVEYYNSTDIKNLSINNANVTGISFSRPVNNFTTISFNLVAFGGSGTFTLFVTTGSGNAIEIPKTIDIIYYGVTLNTS